MTNCVSGGALNSTHSLTVIVVVSLIVCCRPSYALQNIRKKIENENPHVAKFALLVRINLMFFSVI